MSSSAQHHFLQEALLTSLMEALFIALLHCLAITSCSVSHLSLLHEPRDHI